MKRLSTLALSLAVFAICLIPAGIKAQTPVPMPAARVPDTAVPPLVAKFAVKLTSRNAKTGDVVAAKVVKAGRLPDGTVVPKGSRVLGKIGSVQSRKDGNGNSLMTFRLDQVEIKGGAVVPVHGLVVAIGPPMAPSDLFGANSVMARNGTGSSTGMDPNTGLGTVGAMNEEDIRLGSTLEGVSLGRHMDADWTTALRGVHSEIELSPDVVIKVQLK
jgi:hypothetical protein